MSSLTLDVTRSTEPAMVEFDETREPNLVDAYRHLDGSITYVVQDPNGEASNPREDHGNIATLVNLNPRTIDVDQDTANLREAYNRLDVLTFRRYLRMFRSDILHFDLWSAGDSGGFGYVTRAAWDEHMMPPVDRPMTPAEVEQYLNTELTEQRAGVAFRDEVRVYGEWCDGEVYGAVHVTLGAPIVRTWDHGAYVAGFAETEESVWGFLGYEDHADIAAQFTAEPVVEVLY